MSFDNIVKPFASTSAFHHQNHCCNYMAGLLAANSLFGKDDDRAITTDNNRAKDIINSER